MKKKVFIIGSVILVLFIVFNLNEIAYKAGQVSGFFSGFFS
jgi:hypothetical protein